MGMGITNSGIFTVQPMTRPSGVGGKGVKANMRSSAKVKAKKQAKRLKHY